MMMPARLRIVGDLEMPDHCYLPPGAKCYFWGEYTPYEYTQGKFWNYSPTNQLIANFKKSLERQGRPDWQYKQQAIQQVAEAFASFWRWGEMHQKYRLTLVPAPPSKPRDSPLYDSRMGCMLQLLAHQVGVALDIRDCLGFSGAHAASHACSQRPLPNDLYTDLSFDATLGRPEQKPEVIFLFDDMLTTGARYAAMTQKLTQMYPGVEVIGHFIARRVIPNPYMVQTSR